MNSTSLYVTTNQIILKSHPDNPSTWYDLYRLVPYLRNSLCCVVCSNLLVDPQTPSIGRCQHHLCRRCVGGRKKIKPACSWCKTCNNYKENLNLRILLQCYKRMCMTLIKSHIFVELLEQASKNQAATGVERGAGNLIVLIKEGAAFHDNYESKGGLPKSAYSILPCIYTNSSTQTLQLSTTIQNNTDNSSDSNNINLTNGGGTTTTPLYSVMFAGTGNKLTIKRKTKDVTADLKATTTTNVKRDTIDNKPIFKKPPAKCSTKLKRGCRCGNATLTPGKLTCCGQRCPCYVDNKPCIECKCRGCRNPHRPDGNKVIPSILPETQCQLPQTNNNNNNNNIDSQPSNVDRFTNIQIHLHSEGDYSTYKSLNIPESLLEPPLLNGDFEDEDDLNERIIVDV